MSRLQFHQKVIEGLALRHLNELDCPTIPVQPHQTPKKTKLVKLAGTYLFMSNHQKELFSICIHKMYKNLEIYPYLKVSPNPRDLYCFGSASQHAELNALFYLKYRSIRVSHFVAQSVSHTIHLTVDPQVRVWQEI